MKTLKNLGRREAEVLDETGKCIDSARGRDNIWRMKKRHGLDESKPPCKDTSEIPTGFEK